MVGEMKTYIVVFFLWLALGGVVKAQGTADLCAFSRQDKGAIGKWVALRAKVFSDGMHATLLLPKGCEEKSYYLAPDSEVGSPGTVVWQAVMRLGVPGTGYMPGSGDKTIEVDAFGEVIRLSDGSVGVKITKLNQMVIKYSSN
jgi:hypothetical protein